MNPNTFSLLAFCFSVFFLFQGCGFKTLPEPMPEQAPTQYFSEPQFIYRDSQLRIQWQILDGGRKYFANDSINFHETDSVQEKKSRNTFESFNEPVPGLLIEEYYGQRICPDCEDGWFKNEFIPYTSTRFLKEDSSLFLYDPGITDSQLPMIRQIRLSWLDENEEPLQHRAMMGIPPRPVFPEAVSLKVERFPDPTGYEKDDAGIYVEEIFDFGRVLRQLKSGDFETEGTIGGGNTRLSNNEDQTGQAQLSQDKNHSKAIQRRFSSRFSWPTPQESFYQRFPQPGEIIHRTRNYGANLYLLDDNGNLPETPLNGMPLREDHYLFQRDVLISIPGPPIYETDTHPGVLPKQALFYIDLETKKEDILMFKIRLVDRLGNEGPSSHPVAISLPRLMIAEQNWSSKGISPFSY